LLADTLKYNGRTLTLYADDGTVKWQGSATSGRPGATSADQAKSKFGPIPEGSYTTGHIFHEQGLAKVVFEIRTLGADYGNYRTPLTPTAGTDTQGRTSFWLHGGTTPGSAGCIDVGPRDVSLFTLLRQATGPVPLIVDYPQQPIRTAP
jgi:hypothetical protein